jgi:ribosomal protein S18 acetylase RimI-like enzyme
MSNLRIVTTLEHSDQGVAHDIWSLFQHSYAHEAKLIAVQNFGPLNRTIGNIQKSHSSFTGLFVDGAMVAVAETRSNGETLFIDSFVVDPLAFRRGHGSSLLRAILQTANCNRAVVETAEKNEPALRLYEKFGFEQTEHRETEDGIKIVKLITDRLLTA